MMKLKAAVPGYMVQLDGLRALAVAVVILFHWTPEVKQLGLGGLGVQLFFVLSGYLISGILADARAKAEAVGTGKKQIISSFYARRFLRIFPLYYLVIALAAVFGSGNILQYLPWHLTYLTNVAIFLDGNWIGEASHLWSLAVEEQFYLLWPFVILFTPKRYLTATIIGFILLAPFFKLSCMLLGVGGSRLGVLPVSSFHYLGAGALLAVTERSDRFRNSESWRNMYAGRLQLAGITGLLLFSLLQLVPQLQKISSLVPLMQEFATIALFSSLTVGAAYGFKGLGGKVLASKPMVYIGRISYGLYLFHNFVPYFVNRLLRYLQLDANSVLGTSGMLLLYTSVLFGITIASWHFLESKLNRYKGRFPYVSATAPAK